MSGELALDVQQEIEDLGADRDVEREDRFIGTRFIPLSYFLHVLERDAELFVILDTRLLVEGKRKVHCTRRWASEKWRAMPPRRPSSANDNKRNALGRRYGALSCGAGLMHRIGRFAVQPPQNFYR
jgi:hypothetical protein